MTSSLIARKHLDLWQADDPSKDGTPTLRQRLTDAIHEAVELTNAHWISGNATLRHERDTAQAQLNAVKAALNCDESAEDAETAARRLYHERTTMAKQLTTICSDETFPRTSLFDQMTIALLEQRVAHEAKIAAANLQAYWDEIGKQCKYEERITVLENQLAALRQARDDAVAACHLAVQEHEAYVAMMHDRGP